MVFYRKYRPQTIEELDSIDVRDKLYSVLKSFPVPHAFLFTGPKGLGKTSTARIVAKIVNCEVSRGVRVSRVPRGDPNFSPRDTRGTRSTRGTSSIEPCNKCYQCISITNGTNIDVLEIDGASNRGIDEIRDLKEKVRLSPATASKKIYIIDEVHMLTQEAFNALLKTLEEPPSHVIFILCTTEPHKVPATIVSRCFHIAFKKATINELVRSFKRIAEKEKLNIDNETLNFIASLSDGSFRDGVKILEEMATYGKTITRELVEEKYQIRQLADQISEMIESLSKRDAKEGLQLASKLVDQGVDMKYFLEQLISELHQMLLVEIGVNGSPKLEVRSSKLGIEEIKELVELLTRAYAELKYAVLPQLPLELAIVGWGLGGALRSPRQFVDSSNPISSQSANLARAKLSKTEPKYGSFKSSSHAEAPRATLDFWQELINKVKAYNHSVAGVLRGCSLKSYDNKKIIIETRYKFHKERLEEKKTMSIIEKVCEEIAERPVEVVVVLREKS
jgi:DNA polymerase-3 subunit gamma/tau